MLKILMFIINKCSRIMNIKKCEQNIMCLTKEEYQDLHKKAQMHKHNNKLFLFGKSFFCALHYFKQKIAQNIINTDCDMFLDEKNLNNFKNTYVN